jgi:hypothetical protein
VLPTWSILDRGARHHPTTKTSPTPGRRLAGGWVDARGEPTRGGGRRRRCGEAVVALASRGYGNGVERIEFYRDTRCKKGVLSGVIEGLELKRK